MAKSPEVQYQAHDYAQAAKVAESLGKTGYDLSESERSALLKAASVLRSWASSLPSKSS